MLFQIPNTNSLTPTSPLLCALPVHLFLRSAALLVLFARAAYARIVTPDSRALMTDGFRLVLFAAREGRLVRLCKGYAAAPLTPSALKQLLLYGRGDLDLEVEQVADRLGVYAVDHVLEQLERLALVLDE